MNKIALNSMRYEDHRSFLYIFLTLLFCIFPPARFVKNRPLKKILLKQPRPMFLRAFVRVRCIPRKHRVELHKYIHPPSSLIIWKTVNTRLQTTKLKSERTEEGRANPKKIESDNNTTKECLPLLETLRKSKSSQPAKFCAFYGRFFASTAASWPRR